MQPKQANANFLRMNEKAKLSSPFNGSHSILGSDRKKIIATKMSFFSWVRGRSGQLLHYGTLQGSCAVPFFLLSPGEELRREIITSMIIVKALRLSRTLHYSDSLRRGRSPGERSEQSRDSRVLQ